MYLVERLSKSLSLILVTSSLAAGVVVTSALSEKAFAQSLDVKHPAELKEGPNSGTIDSFGGSQFWFFNAKPGNFKCTFTRSGTQEGFNVGPKAGAGAIINPAVQGSTLSTKDLPTGALFEGHCDKPTRVLVMIEPAKSPLVRQTNNYTITVVGSSGSAEAINAAPDAVAGVYDVNINDYGVAKLSPDGSISTTSGANGKWTLFDNATRTYVLMIGNDKWNATFEPARGFVDKNGNLLFSLKKAVRN